MKNLRQNGFSLLELVFVIGLMSLLLILGASALVRTGEGEARQAARALVLGMMTNARARALTQGEFFAVVMCPYQQGRQELLGRGLTVCEVREDETTGQWEVVKQVRRWTALPGRMIFSGGGTVNQGGQNAFLQNPVLKMPVRISGAAELARVEMPAVIFGASGNVVWPQGSGELELHLSEGAVLPNLEVRTVDEVSEWEKREVFIIGRQTGRARYLRTR